MSEETTETPSSKTENSKPAMFWTGWIITGLLSALFTFSASAKIFGLGGEEAAKGLEKSGLPADQMIGLGIVELLCVVIYIIPRTSVLGAILLAGYMGGAICTHWRIGEPYWFQFLIGVLVWLGIYLREPRLRKILPLR